MTKPVQLPPSDLSVSATVSPFPSGDQGLAALSSRVETLKASTLLAVAAAQAARRLLAGQLPAAAGETNAGDIGSFGT